MKDKHNQSSLASKTILNISFPEPVSGDNNKTPIFTNTSSENVIDSKFLRNKRLLLDISKYDNDEITIKNPTNKSDENKKLKINKKNKSLILNENNNHNDNCDMIYQKNSNKSKRKKYLIEESKKRKFKDDENEKLYKIDNMDKRRLNKKNSKNLSIKCRDLVKNYQILDDLNIKKFNEMKKDKFSSKISEVLNITDDEININKELINNNNKKINKSNELYEDNDYKNNEKYQLSMFANLSKSIKIKNKNFDNYIISTITDKNNNYIYSDSNNVLDNSKSNKNPIFIILFLIISSLLIITIPIVITFLDFSNLEKTQLVSSEEKNIYELLSLLKIECSNNKYLTSFWLQNDLDNFYHFYYFCNTSKDFKITKTYFEKNEYTLVDKNQRDIISLIKQEIRCRNNDAILGINFLYDKPNDKFTYVYNCGEIEIIVKNYKIECEKASTMENIFSYKNDPFSDLKGIKVEKSNFKYLNSIKLSKKWRRTVNYIFYDIKVCR